MKENIILVVLGIIVAAMGATAIINFIQGNVLQGASDALMLCSGYILAWVLIRQKFQLDILKVIGKSHFDLVKSLKKAMLDKDDDNDNEEVEISEKEMPEDEKRLKRMAEEYDQLAGRLHRLQAFRDTDTYKQLPENSRYLLDKQCKAMDDYESILKQRLQIKCDTANEKKED